MASLLVRHLRQPLFSATKVSRIFATVSKTILEQFSEQRKKSDFKILDCSCGIGTQSLGLAPFVCIVNFQKNCNHCWDKI
jgi:hypothetical protein